LDNGIDRYQTYQAAHSSHQEDPLDPSDTKVQWTTFIESRIISLMESLKGRSANEPRLLSVVDDDESMRDSLPDLIKEFGFAARAFSSADEFLSSGSIDETSCLILDIAMPGMSGPELYEELKRRGREIPTIFITAQKDERIRARVFEQGAAGFLLKPFSDADLLAAIKSALQAI
jgi:FixJ family two-component response regulator